MSPSFCVRSCFCTSTASSICAGVAWPGVDQHLADLRAELEAGVRGARDERALDAAVVFTRREDEQAELGLDVADRHAAQLAAGAELDPVRRALALAEQCRVRIGCATAAAARSGVVSVSAVNWSKRSARVVRAGGICTWATEVSGTKNVRRAEISFSSAPNQDLARQRLGLLGRRGIARVRRRRPEEGVAAALFLRQAIRRRRALRRRRAPGPAALSS